MDPFHLGTICGFRGQDSKCSPVQLARQIKQYADALGPLGMSFAGKMLQVFGIDYDSAGLHNINLTYKTKTLQNQR